MNLNLTRRSLALSLYSLMVGSVLLSLLCSFGESFAIYRLQAARQTAINQLNAACTQLVVLRISTHEFDKIQVRAGKECVLGGSFFDVVSIRNENGELVLTLLPDSEETALQKKMGMRLTHSRSSRRGPKITVAGFLFYESLQSPLLPFFAPTKAAPIGYCRFIAEPFLGIALPPPKFSAAC